MFLILLEIFVLIVGSNIREGRLVQNATLRCVEYAQILNMKCFVRLQNIFITVVTNFV